MTLMASLSSVARVALRKESVDRNPEEVENYEEQTEVALRKESVDRNLGLEPLLRARIRRSPQGERG